MILLIDNYDSFTWNLVQRLGELDPSLEPDRDLLVVRNDKITPDQAAALDGGRGPTHLIISPGPCTPAEAGVSSAMIERFAGRIPVLGVCLGHQCIGHMNGMTVARHAVPMHGKTSPVLHDGVGIFRGLPNPMTATRYHSLVVVPETVPARRNGHDGWAVSAWTDEKAEDGSTRRVVMGLRRVWEDASRAPLEGVQFHPESFLTDAGPQLLANFLAMGAAQRVGPASAPYSLSMITPAPTTKIDPKLARGTLAGVTDATATKPATITLSIPNTSYELHLIPAGPIRAAAGKRIIGTIRADAKRLDTVKTGGRYIEPVYGRPRRVQGTIVAVDTAANAVVVDATVPIHCRLTDPRQKAADFEVGLLVSCDVMDGARFEERA